MVKKRMDNRRNFIKKTGLFTGAFALGGFPSLVSEQDDTWSDIVILGDSISMGYLPFVKEGISGKTVWRPEENCRTTSAIIYRLYDWVTIRKPKVVHVNAGLHDIRTLYFDAKPGNVVTPIGHYKDNVETILRFIREQAGAKAVWAATTPVMDENIRKVHEKRKDYTRYNEDVIACNNVAKSVCDKLNVPYNDLYQVVMNAGVSGIQKGDGVHYTGEGSKLLAEKVVASIKEAL
jgi:lysophospholipase L1-like esterase